MKHEGADDIMVRREVSEKEWKLFKERMDRWGIKKDTSTNY